MKKILFVLLLVVISIVFYKYGRNVWYPVTVKVVGPKTVAEIISQYENNVRHELLPLFTDAGVSYPPSQLALVAFKDSKILELWAADQLSNYVLIKSYPIKAASGVLGPKLREGDRQVPEGIYKVSGFNPNSSYHLSMKINYPNAFDLSHAKAEGRTEPGTNIFIHGRAVSVGCLAMGDPAIEQLFTLVRKVGRVNTTVLISPTDPSKNELAIPGGAPDWTAELYEKIKTQYALINRSYQHYLTN